MKENEISLYEFMSELRDEQEVIQYTKTDMYGFIKFITLNFDRRTTEFAINDIRDYIWECTVYLKESVTLEGYNINMRDIYLEDLLNNLKINDFEFSENQTFKQRIEQIENRFSNLLEPFENLKLVEFSEIAEKEYKRVLESTPNQPEPTLKGIKRPDSRDMNFKDLSIVDFMDYISGSRKFQGIETIIFEPEMLEYLENKTSDFSKDRFDVVIKYIRDYVKRAENRIKVVEESDDPILVIKMTGFLSPNFDYEKLFEFSDIAEREYKRVKETKVVNPDIEPKEIIPDYGKLQFEKNTLSVLHGYFNDEIWDDIDINQFYNNFREIPLKTLTIKSIPAFCYLIAKYENKKIDILNINKWMKEHFNILNYSKDKNKPLYKTRQGKNAKYYKLIESKEK